MKPLFYTLLLAGLVAPWATQAQAGPRMMTPLQVECVRGVVVVRSITTMVQLNSPETGKPMTCQEKSAQTIRMEHDIESARLQLNIAEQTAARLQATIGIQEISISDKDKFIESLTAGPRRP